MANWGVCVAMGGWWWLFPWRSTNASKRAPVLHFSFVRRGAAAAAAAMIKGKFKDYQGNSLGRDIEHPLLAPANESLEALKAKMAEKGLDIDCRDEVRVCRRGSRGCGCYLVTRLTAPFDDAACAFVPDWDDCAHGRSHAQRPGGHPKSPCRWRRYGHQGLDCEPARMSPPNAAARVHAQ